MEKTCGEGQNEMKGDREWGGGWCCLLLSISSPTHLISLLVIKNYSQDGIINLPTQPCTLNGALQTRQKKWACAFCASSKFICFIHMVAFFFFFFSFFNKQAQLVGLSSHRQVSDCSVQKDILHLSAITAASIAFSPLSLFIISAYVPLSDRDPGHKLLGVRLQTSGGSSSLKLFW